MSNALGGSVGIVGYLALFAGVGFAFVFVNLLVGRLFRPANPTPEKLEIYECGEPTIGSSFVQFDLRFYVVALIFIIFDVEVAFLFPWATVFGKAHEMAHPRTQPVAVTETGAIEMTPATRAAYQELGLRNPTLPSTDAKEAADLMQNGGKLLLWLATVEVLVFFAILLIAFAYEWKIGALDWVRAIVDEFKQQQLAANPPPGDSSGSETNQPVLSA